MGSLHANEASAGTVGEVTPGSDDVGGDDDVVDAADGALVPEQPQSSSTAAAVSPRIMRHCTAQARRPEEDLTLTLRQAALSSSS